MLIREDSRYEGGKIYCCNLGHMFIAGEDTCICGEAKPMKVVPIDD